MMKFTLKRLTEIGANRKDGQIRVEMQFELKDTELVYAFQLDYDPKYITHVLDLKTLFDQQRAALNEESHPAWDEAVTAFYAHT